MVPVIKDSSPIIVDGKKIYERILVNVRKKIEDIMKEGYRVKLSIIAIGDDSEMKIFIRNKKKAADFCGIEIQEFYLPQDTDENEVIRKIYELNASKDTCGFLVQLPLPPQVRKNVLEIISPEKDVDCLTSENLGMVLKDHTTSRFVPCACQAMLDIFEIYGVDVDGKKGVVVGSSDLVGKPCAAVLINLGATVTICHKGTHNLAEFIKDADIVVSAVGKPGIIKGEWIKKGAVVIDIGTRVVNGRVMGDVEFAEASKRASIITPVPGGVGIITVAELMRNTLKAFYYSISAMTSPSVMEPPSLT